MRPDKYLSAILIPFLFCACALPFRKPSPPAPPAKKEAAVGLSPEDANKVESLYYKAVGAYSGNDLDAALKYLDEISAIHHSYPPAAELREKIRSVSGTR